MLNPERKETSDSALMQIKGIRSLASDNNSGAHSEVLKALITANDNHAVGYGDDPWTRLAIDRIKTLFGGDPKVLFTLNGTGANVLAIASCISRFEAVICSQNSHIHCDECGAPEAFTGSKLITFESPDGKLTVEHLKRAVAWQGDRHHSQPRLVSITQSNELGICYSIAEMKSLIDFAHSHSLLVHVDGARISNAAASLGVSLRELTTDLGIDILSFGGTKNGLAFGECVVVFNPELYANLDFHQKQTGQLASKMRFISAQFVAYLNNDLYLHNARHANAMSTKLEYGIAALGIEITRPVQANAVFCKLNQTQIDALLKSYFFYIWDPATHEVRFMTSFDTTEQDIEGFLDVLKSTI